MTSATSRGSRLALAGLVLAPLSVITVLTITVILPSLQDPQSAFYSSSLGYPARQRQLGKPIKVETAKVKFENIATNLAAPGESSALTQVEIRPQVEAIVEQVLVQEGDLVKQGQPLIKLDQIFFKEQMEKATQELDIAKVQLKNLEYRFFGETQYLENNIKAAKEQIANAQKRIQETINISRNQQKTAIIAAKGRLDIAIERLASIKSLVESGALSRFSLLEAEEAVVTRQKEHDLAKEETFDNKDQIYENQELLITRQSQLEKAQQELSTSKKTHIEELKKANLNIQIKKIQLQQAINQLKLTTIKAPISGLISQINTTTGDLAHSSQADKLRPPLMIIAHQIVFKAYIDQAQLNTVKIGNSANIRLVGYPGQVLTGTVIKINPAVETEDIRPRRVGADRQYTYSAWIQVNKADLPPGVQGFAQFNKNNPMIIIPESSVVHLSGGEAMVMVVQNNRAKVRSVKLGRIFDNQRQVISGLKVGEQVILYPKGLNPDDKIELKNK